MPPFLTTLLTGVAAALVEKLLVHLAKAAMAHVSAARAAA